jgi:hypothetical protein
MHPVFDFASRDRADVSRRSVQRRNSMPEIAEAAQ